MTAPPRREAAVLELNWVMNDSVAVEAAVAARAGREAPVHITTRELYDRIQFQDVDSGAWKQGWEVAYRGDEWDGEKLKVFVAPYSHNGPGWIHTVEYYQRQSRHILDTIVESLSKDLCRKFICEMSYLERWWRDAPKKTRRDPAVLHPPRPCLAVVSLPVRSRILTDEEDENLGHATVPASGNTPSPVIPQCNRLVLL